MANSSHSLGMMDVFRKLFPGEYYKKFFEKNVRPDDRTLLSIRKTTISVGSITSAYGSAFVKIGNTTVLCGIRGEVGLVPLETDPTNAFDRRHVVVNLEMLPLCSPLIRSGKPLELAQIVAQRLNDLCDKLLDVSALYSKSDANHFGDLQAAWYLYADLYCFDYDGNIQDCAGIALLSALKSTLLPPIEVTPAGEAIVSGNPADRNISLQLSHLPISTTFGIVENHIFADPNLEEEGILNGSLTIVYDENGILCALDKPGGTSVTDEQLKECMKLARGRVGPVASYINQTVSTYLKRIGKGN